MLNLSGESNAYIFSILYPSVCLCVPTIKEVNNCTIYYLKKNICKPTDHLNPLLVQGIQTILT